jgi:hypothetical protein
MWSRDGPERKLVGGDWRRTINGVDAIDHGGRLSQANL